jgi:capsular polysaccharide transport system permease protein
MSATYIHTKRKVGISGIILRTLAVLYFIAIALTVVYIWAFTQDRYVTTAAFKISRQDGSSVDSGLVQLALPGLTDSGSMDSQIAIGFVGSADLLMALEKEFDLIAHYTAPKRDFVFRMQPDWLLEDRLEFYRKRIFAHFDKDTGLTAVSVDTFDPELSHKIAQAVLTRAEAFINVINQEIADQQLAFVRSEVERTGTRVEEINRQLLELQNKHKFISPDDLIKGSVSAVQELQMDHLRADAELASLLRDSPGSPQIETLRSRLRSLQELIDIETAKLSGSERDRMNQILVEYKELELKLEFANRLRSGAEMMLEKNRIEAASRSRFFSVIQKPFLPEDSALPRREYATATIIVLGILLFLVFRALTHSILEGS